MDCKKIGKLIYNLRKEKNMTQKQVADLMNISDKTISKWERGLGCPDISLLSELAEIFCVSVDRILEGEINLNNLVGGNMNKLKFYVCPQCNNLMTATGNAEISCCGKKLEALEAKKSDEKHVLNIEPVEDELYITSNHSMDKEHYISFLAYLKGDSVLIAKQYPEWDLQLRLRKRGHGRLFYYCTNHGLFYQIV
ncbi:helix-turn-helix domain-containing protein [Romboutsia sp. Marseille-P6047]|uniref:helix-turn-helix domain-containing protein n=1 Tax=Romboutsia sp. Marseille-P6047 TaxID=2161817 RepID=UPI0008215A83|nr:helix-turn-helix domain-containing protein [Romboutsia sp. Marseille-P6047]SCH88929.1 transcriptional repressor DicA [uncultured Clostridium sp.]